MKLMLQFHQLRLNVVLKLNHLTVRHITDAVRYQIVILRLLLRTSKVGLHNLICLRLLRGSDHLCGRVFRRLELISCGNCGLVRVRLKDITPNS